jgi:hypothetical protein
MECVICGKEQGAGGELPVCVHRDGKKAHEQCFVKSRAFALMNGGGWVASCRSAPAACPPTDTRRQAAALVSCSDDEPGYTFDWTSKVHVYLPTDVAELVKGMLAK